PPARPQPGPRRSRVGPGPAVAATPPRRAGGTSTEKQHQSPKPSLWRRRTMSLSSFRIHLVAVVLGAAAPAAAAGAVVTAPAGYIYSTQLLSNLTQNCIAAGPGGTFVGIGKGFTPNAGSIVLAKESGELRLVASG